MESKERIDRMTKLLKCFQSIESFNDVIGNPDSYEGVYNQLLRVQEEVEETIDSFNIAHYPFELIGVNDKELLDGVADVLVTALGLIKKLESLEYDVLGGLEAVCLNNESKYCKNEEHAIQTHQYYLDQGIETYREWSEKGFCWVVKRTSDSKLLKPVGYESVELDKFLPKE